MFSARAVETKFCNFVYVCLALSLVLLCGADKVENLDQRSRANLRPTVLKTHLGPRMLELGARTPINPPGSGYHGEVMIAADPESQDNLIVCGFRANQESGAAYEGYVYWSGDG